MTRHFVIRVGDWQFVNWHLYHLRQHRARGNPDNTWMMWDRVF